MPLFRLARASVLVSLLFIAACHSDSAPRSCRSDAECDTGESCVGTSCVTLDAGPVQPTGGACFESLQCAAGLTCALDATGLRDGLCTEVCTVGSCPSNTICADLRSTPVNAQLCLPLPGDGGACRAGYSGCAAFGNACLPAALCPSTTASAAASPDLGVACGAGTCATGETCRFGLDFPSGACTMSCAVEAPSSCPSNGTCVVTDQGPVCVLNCMLGGVPCRTGYACTAQVSGSVCLSTAQGPRACPGASLVLSGGTAGPSKEPGFCVEPVSPSSLPVALVQEFGAHSIGDVVQFQVPAQSASVSIVSQAIHARGVLDYQGFALDNTVVPTDIAEPGGTLIYQDGVASPSDLSTATVYYATDAPSTGVLTFPNTTAGLLIADGGLPSGTWTFRVNDYATECLNTPGCDGGASDGVYDVSVIVKPGPARTSGTIDVAFYLVDAAGLTSETAPLNAHVKRMISTLASIYAQAGICLGSVTFYDVPAWAQAKYSNGLSVDKTGPCDELNQMFTLARAGNTLNFFLVGEISSTNARGTVVGVDGAIPGASTLGGTIHSGAAVSAADLTAGTCSGSAIDLAHCGADVVAYIAAHEGGHWMGLYHTTEAPGDYFDPLSDTATCSCTVCTTGSRKNACRSASNPNPTIPTYVQASDCNSSTQLSCGGATDLMFWLLDENVSTGTLSSQQGNVMRRNLLVQ